MNAIHTFRVAKASFLLIFMMLTAVVNAQVYPYAYSPKWYFGQGGGMDFTGGGAPVVMTGNALNTEEMMSTICFPNKNVALYSNNFSLVSGANAVYGTNPGGSTSSTNGPVIIPDPASPTNRYYVFTGNAEVTGTGGGAGGQGIRAFLVTTSGTTISSMVAQTPNPLTGSTGMSEALTSGTTDDGGYWVVSHVRGGTTYNAWKVTSTGISAPVTSNGTSSPVAASWQGSIKISRCQDRIAMVSWNGEVEVYTWNRTTGRVGTLLRHLSGYTNLYGCEFSPNGNILYFTSLPGNKLYQLDIATGAIYSPAGWVSSNDDPSMGTLQMGPDNKIYVCNVDWFVTMPSYIGVINFPDVVGAGCTYNGTGFVLNSGTGWYPSIYRGFANIARLQPTATLSIVSGNGTCNIQYKFDFQTYFLDNITVDVPTIEWDIDGDNTYESAYNGQVSPTVDYTGYADGPYTVQVRFRDAGCGHTWTDSYTPANVSCPMPVTWLEINADVVSDGVDITWATSSENNSSHFVVQRSQDGSTFTNIGTVAAAGNSNTIRNYSFKDLNPYTGVTYYRIVQYDIDGRFTTSRIVVVNLNDVTLNVFPNPSSGQFELELAGAGQAELTVTDVLGRVVYTGSLKGDYVNTRFGDDLGKGTYVLTVVTPAKTLHEKLVKE